MKRIAIAALVFAAVAAAVMRRDSGVLAANLGITAYPGGTVMVQVPWRRDAPQGTVSVWIQGTEAVHAFPGWPRKYWNDNYYYAPAAPLPDEVRVRVAFSGEPGDAIERTVRVSRSSDTGIAPELAGVTHAADSMKKMPDLPDLAQYPGQCAPVAAVNALIALIRTHGADDHLPADWASTVDELKRDMGWNPADGVLPDGFVAGANLWAQKKGLSIVTEKVGSAKGKGTLDALAAALDGGAAAQLRLSLVGAGGKAMGGHMATVAALVYIGDELFVALNDPRSPDGSDVYRVRDGRIEGYALWHDGPVLVSWGFTHDWREGTH